MLKTKPKK